MSDFSLVAHYTKKTEENTGKDKGWGRGKEWSLENCYLHNTTESVSTFAMPVSIRARHLHIYSRMSHPSQANA